MKPILIGIVADFDSANRSHAATHDAVLHCAEFLNLPVQPVWIGTEEFLELHTSGGYVGYRGFWIGPGSPYKSMDGALLPIRTARERNIPLLGTCGGFQHIILEYARNLLGQPDAGHEESNPEAPRLFVSRLSCSLVGRTMVITLASGSLLAAAYRCPQVKEEYHCNYGVNPEYVSALRSGGLRIVASDDEGAARAVELPGHPFFLGTLFLPQHTSTRLAPHPVVCEFLKACSQQA